MSSIHTNLDRQEIRTHDSWRVYIKFTSSCTFASLEVSWMSIVWTESAPSEHCMSIVWALTYNVYSSDNEVRVRCICSFQFFMKFWKCADLYFLTMVLPVEKQYEWTLTDNRYTVKTSNEFQWGNWLCQMSVKIMVLIS